MRILTLWQPWASLIALKLKQYETRSWPTGYRGKLAIHAAKRPFVSADGSETLDQAAWLTWLDALELAHEAGILTNESKLPFAHELPLGCIVAIADLTACLEMADNISRPPSEIACMGLHTPLELAVGDWQVGRYAWKLKNVIALPEPIPFKGAQGLRELTDTAVLQAIAEQVEVRL
jgi:hypothetical protein